jgi:glycosyltransferase involved in cell wall biosynthesis
MIRASVIVVTKNEENNIAKCLAKLSRFDDVWVIDSESQDKTVQIAKNFPVTVRNFQWNKQYPKKRQYCLDSLPLKYDWVFFVDADELIPDILIDEIENLISSDPVEPGFFITGKYSIHQKILNFGFQNKKIVLLHRGRMEFPVVDDLDVPGMGEIEGHYQPVLKKEFQNLKVGTLKNFMIHDTLDDVRVWNFRHEKYARWEAGMNAKGAWPQDPIAWREFIKSSIRRSRFRPEIVFLGAYLLKLGFLDGRNGLFWAKQRYKYLNKINSLSR